MTAKFSNSYESSTLGWLESVFVDGPVWVIGTKRSEFCWIAGLRGAVTVNTPSEDNVDEISFGLTPAE